MNIEAILDHYICNGEVLSTENLREFSKITAPSIYEVIKVIDGIPLYEEEHLNRMRKSAELLGYEIHKSNNDISKDIRNLIKINEVTNLNIKIVCSNLDKKEQTLLVYFIESFYPSTIQYQYGIHTILFYSQRDNPNVKIVNADLRAKANLKIKEEGAYEALLIDKHGYITEGSRSNIFLVKKDKVYTAPAGEVLLGITRKKILKACEDLSFDIVEQHVHIDQLGEFEGVFMTGTSVGVLPIATIDNRSYDSADNEIVKSIRKAYLQNVECYLDSIK